MKRFAFLILVLCTPLSVESSAQTLDSLWWDTDHITDHEAFKTSKSIAPPAISFIQETAVVLEYESVYDVHVEPDTINFPNIRIQGGGFDNNRILADLETVVDPSDYDFVLLYTLHEVPGWINSGPRYSVPAKNIGLSNSSYGSSWAPESWPKLRGVPHMNSVEFSKEIDYGHGGGELIAFHEMNHYWGVFITAQSSVGPREWTQDDPIAWLASCCGHWTWVWQEEGMPGIMYSGPTSNQFNAFDLYFMGLMGFDEASQYSHQVYEYILPPPPEPVLHDVTLDDFIYALSLAGNALYEGNGHRIPDLDPESEQLRILPVVVKGEDEVLSQEYKDFMVELASTISEGWTIATWGRSSLTVGVDLLDTVPQGDPGTTVIIHGHRGGTDWNGDDGITEDQEWALTMAEAIINRLGQGEVYVIGCNPPDTNGEGCGGQITTPDDLEALMEGVSFKKGEPGGEKVIVFDWLEESNDAVFGYTEAAADALTALLIKGAQEGTWGLENLHVIGHSRGTIVASETLQRLAWHSDNENGASIGGIPVDQDIQFTALDAHPWDNAWWDFIGEPFGFGSAEDHDVNTFSEGVDFLGTDREHFGVICWKENVRYCENYWQGDNIDNLNLDGLRDIPGVSFKANTDLSATLAPLLDGLDFGHGKIHRWYHGTINLATDLEDDGYSTDESNSLCTEGDGGSCGNPIHSSWYGANGLTCNQQFDRYSGGYNRSVRIAGELNTECIQSDADQPSIYDDQTLLDSNGLIHLFNGDLSLRGLNDTPGWDFQGGHAPFASLDLLTFNPHISLDSERSRATHNWMYIPAEGVEELSFRIKITNFDFELNGNNLDRLKLYLGDEENEFLHPLIGIHGDSPCDDLKMNGLMVNYVTCFVPISAFKGHPWRLTFDLDAGEDGEIDSAVSIDNVAYTNSSFLQATLSPSLTGGKHPGEGLLADLHVYDAMGNHTGRNSDSTWVEEISGSRFGLVTDSSGATYQVVSLPPAPPGTEYTFQVVSRGDAGEVNLAFEDATQGSRTVTGYFEAISLQAQTQVSTTMHQVDAGLQLEMDQDGDGMPEDSLTTNQFNRVHLVHTAPGPGGSISPSGTQSLNYGDTLTVSILAEDGYTIEDVLIDSVSVGGIDTYTFQNISTDHTISASFVQISNTDTEAPDSYTYRLEPNYPNPFSQETSITYSIPSAQHVSLGVFDILGREVQVLVDDVISPGIHVISFDGRELPSGTYYYQIKAGPYLKTKQFVVLR